jgi:vancomycin resistance protein YoaR
MKMTNAHYQELKEKVAILAPKLPDYIKQISADQKIKDVEARVLFDTFHATKIMNNHSYQEFNYDDAHIKTAMRSIFKDLQISLDPVVAMTDGKRTSAPRVK